MTHNFDYASFYLFIGLIPTTSIKDEIGKCVALSRADGVGDKY
jgi:hypothetical protein